VISSTLVRVVRCSLTLVALVAACAAAKPKLAVSMRVVRYKLPNGMTVVLVPDRSAVLATMLVRYRVERCPPRVVLITSSSNR
jgi:hypothetical protein